MWMLYALWLIIAHAWSIRVYRYMDVITGNLFCFVQIACGSKNVFTLWNYLGGSKWKLRRNLVGAICKRRRNREKGTARVLPKLQEISKTVVNSVSPLTRESQFAIILLWPSKRVEKKNSKKQYTSKIQRKWRSRQKVPFRTQKMPKLAQIPEHEQSSSMCMSSGDAFACGSCTTSLFLFLFLFFFFYHIFRRHLWSITKQTHGNMESIIPTS